MNSFYRAYLDEVVDRRGTDCVKWDFMWRNYGTNDLAPAWVADMDFRTVPAVQEALAKRTEHAIFGYSDSVEKDKAAEIGWLQRRHNCHVEPDWILYSPGVVDSIYVCVDALTNEGDKVLLQPPTYGPFFSAVRDLNRTLVRNPLVETEEGWRMDYEDLEAKLADGVKMMIMCSPQNPVGRVWKRWEIEKVLELTKRYNVILISDEIHGDFALGDNVQQRILTFENTDHCIMMSAPTKSFNLAGLRTSSCIIKNPEMRAKVQKLMGRYHISYPNMFGAIAQRAAYTHGDEWMDAVKEYIRENRDYCIEYMRENLPEIKVRPQEGMYVLWMDFSALGMSHEDMAKMLVEKCHVAFHSGLNFGEEGEKHFRMNIAGPRKNIERVLENLKNGIRSL